MEGHPALPDREDLQRIGEVFGQIIEQHEAEPAADHDAERREQQEIVERLRIRPRPPAPERAGGRKLARIPPAAEQAGDIGEPVPFDRERPELQRDRVDHREGNGEDGHGQRVRITRCGDAHPKARTSSGKRCKPNQNNSKLNSEFCYL